MKAHGRPQRSPLPWAGRPGIAVTCLQWNRLSSLDGPDWKGPELPRSEPEPSVVPESDAASDGRRPERLKTVDSPRPPGGQMSRSWRAL